MAKQTARTALRAARRYREKMQRVRRLVGKTENELNGNQQRTLRMALEQNYVEFDPWSGVIQKKGVW